MAKEKQRYMYIDLVRGWAVLVMIEVHVFNTFLLPEVRSEAWFKVLNFINGLVAPSFLFIAGYSFTLIAQRKWNDYLAASPIFWKQIGRILQIWIVGYALHLPFFSLHKLTIIGWEEWGVFWKIDVLHCIAASLLTLLLLVLVMREQKKYFAAVALLAFGIIVTSPVMYERNLDAMMPLPLANYFSAVHRSLFPLFPWMAFVLCGGLASQLLVWWKERMPEEKIFKRFFYAGIVMLIGALLSDLIPWKFYPVHDFWRSSPAFFFIRLGIVFIILSTLWYWEKVAHSTTSFVSVVGSESLVAYAGHLLVIYGMFFDNHSLAFLIGPTRTIAEVVGMTTLLLVATAAASYVWHRIKAWSIFYARVMQYSILIVVLYVFYTKPF